MRDTVKKAMAESPGCGFEAAPSFRICRRPHKPLEPLLSMDLSLSSVIFCGIRLRLYLSKYDLTLSVTNEVTNMRTKHHLSIFMFAQVKIMHQYDNNHILRAA